METPKNRDLTPYRRVWIMNGEASATSIDDGCPFVLVLAIIKWLLMLMPLLLL